MNLLSENRRIISCLSVKPRYSISPTTFEIYALNDSVFKALATTVIKTSDVLFGYHVKPDSGVKIPPSAHQHLLVLISSNKPTTLLCIACMWSFLHHLYLLLPTTHLL